MIDHLLGRIVVHAEHVAHSLYPDTHGYPSIANRDRTQTGEIRLTMSTVLIS
jgi:hypothetical protein